MTTNFVCLIINLIVNLFIMIIISSFVYYFFCPVLVFFSLRIYYKITCETKHDRDFLVSGHCRITFTIIFQFIFFSVFYFLLQNVSLTRIFAFPFYPCCHFLCTLKNRFSFFLLILKIYLY